MPQFFTSKQLTLHKASCTRQFMSKPTLRPFTLPFSATSSRLPYGQHHRAGDDAEMCARLFLWELEDVGWCGLEEIDYCSERL